MRRTILLTGSRFILSAPHLICDQQLSSGIKYVFWYRSYVSRMESHWNGMKA